MDNRPLSAWLTQKLDGFRFHDARLARCFCKLAAQLWDNLGQSIPLACQDWANTKAAYRFFANDHVSEGTIQDGHFHSTNERFHATTDAVLVLHDATTFSLQRDDPQPIGITHKTHGRKDKQGRQQHRTVCGILMHSSLAVTLEDLPLGLVVVKFWRWKKF